MAKRRVIAACLAILAVAELVVAGQVSVDVKEIRANDRIVGSVQGLPAGQNDQYKVLVYVHTDQWYIHPYAGQGEGQSYATINADGSWSLATVKREFKADQLGTLVTPKGFKAPGKVEDIRAIPNEAIMVRALEGTPDYGKL